MTETSPTQIIPDIQSSQDKENKSPKDVTKSDSNNDSQEKKGFLSMLGLNLSNNFMSKISEPTTTSTSSGLDLSVLERIKKRLGSTNNENSSLNDTQVINNDDTQKLPSQTQSQTQSTFKFQLLPQLEVDESEYQTKLTTQEVPKVSNLDPTQELSKISNLDPTQVLPAPDKDETTQKSVENNQTRDLDTVNTKDDQTATNKSNLNDLFVTDESDVGETNTLPLSKDERLRKITELAEKKKQERLAKEKEQELLQKDLTKGSITDEEDDLNNEANDTVISSHMRSDGLSTKELEKAQEFLIIQKRQIDIRPDFERKQTFTKDKFLDLFSDSDSDDADEEFNKRYLKKDHPNTDNLKPSSPVQDDLRSSPTTSPMKDDLYDLFQIPSKTQPKNPLEMYAQKLKRELASSPTSNTKVINLDSDSDIEIGHSSSPIRTTQFKSKFSNNAKELKTIPELSKEKKFLIKQKFMRKKYQNTKQLKSKDLELKNRQHKEFLKQLQKRNIDQLKTNRLNDHEYQVLEEFEKEEESLSSLLEREMERNRNIRKKEKLQERAKLALLGKKLGMKMTESDDEDEVGDSDVPESDYESNNYDGPSAGENSDPSEDEEEELKVNVEQQLDDSDDSMDKDLFDAGSNNVEATHPKDQEDSFISIQNDKGLIGQLPDFKDLTQSQTQTQQETQFDAPTQVDTSFSNNDGKPDLAATQIIKQETIKKEYYDDEDDDVITPAHVKKGRKSLHNRMVKIKQEAYSDIEEEDEDEVENEDDPEVVQRKVKEYEQKIRLKELKARKRRKEMERKGLKTILDGEAEESEDEWKGLGGIDGEFSDVANSDDEKMIDNNFNIDLQNDEIRKKFMEEYQIKDQKELEKLLDDIKNHKLIKRVGQNNGLDIELSDEEDQLLAAYRKQKLIEQQARLMQNKKLQALSKNEKSKAFFDTIQDKHEIIKIDSDSENDDDEVEEIANPFKSNEEKNKDKDENEKENEDNDDDLEKEEPIKKSIKIKESFVQNKLSFLHQSVYDDDDEVAYQRIQKMSNFQYGISDDDDDIDDLNALKSKSSLNKINSITDSNETTNSKKRNLDEETDIDSEDNEFLPIFKRPSITKSFKSFHEEKGDMVKDGKQHFSGVTISKSYKVVSGSKASITYMSKNSNNTKLKSLKEQKIEKNLKQFSNSNHSSIFSNSEF